MKLVLAWFFLVIAAFISYGWTNELAIAGIWAAAMIGAAILLSSGDRAIYSINAYDNEEMRRGG